MMQAPIGILGLYEWEAAEIPQVGTGRGTGRCFRVNLWVLLFFPKNPAQNSIFLTPSRKGRQGLLWQFLSSLICCTLFPQLKADFLGRLFRRSHQLADSIKYDLELGIIFLLQRFKFASQLNTRLGDKSALFWATLILTVHNPFGSTNDGSSKCLPDHTLTNTPT
jgi:hypothetical protein